MWPDDHRSVSVGDVIQVTRPVHSTVYLAVCPRTFFPVDEPTAPAPQTAADRT